MGLNRCLNSKLRKLNSGYHILLNDSRKSKFVSFSKRGPKLQELSCL